MVRKMQYVIKSVPSNDTQALQNLLNEMSMAGWDLYSMHEIESEDDGFNFNCIFMSDSQGETQDKTDFDDIVNIQTFKSQMEKMLTAQISPYEICRDIQAKIREKKALIAKIKQQLETEAPNKRKHLNDEISKSIKELEGLRQALIREISPEAMCSKIHEEKFAIHLSEEILEFVSPDSEENLLAETVKVRQNLTEKFGYVIPKIVFQDDDKLDSYEFSVVIRGLVALKDNAYPNYLMFYKDELNLDKKVKNAVYAQHPISGREIIWIEAEKTKDFWVQGLTPVQYIAQLVEELSVIHVDDLMDYNDINKYMDIVAENNLFLVDNIIPDFISVSELKYILTSLVREKISIKDIVYIFEKINDFSDEPTKESLLDKLRLSLCKYISRDLCNEDGSVEVYELSEKTLDALFSITDDSDGIVKVESAKVEKIVNKIRKIKTDEIILLVPLDVRHMTFMVLSQFIPDIKVVCIEELSGTCDISIIDSI